MLVSSISALLLVIVRHLRNLLGVSLVFKHFLSKIRVIHFDVIEVAHAHANLPRHHHGIAKESGPESAVPSLVAKTGLVELITRLLAQVEVRPCLLRVQVDGDGTAVELSRYAEGLHCTALIIFRRCRRRHQQVLDRAR